MYARTVVTKFFIIKLYELHSQKSQPLQLLKHLHILLGQAPNHFSLVSTPTLTNYGEPPSLGEDVHHVRGVHVRGEDHLPTRAVWLASAV